MLYTLFKMHTFIRGDDHLSLVVDQQDGVT